MRESQMQERKEQFERHYAEVVAQRDRALANVEGKAAQPERRDRPKTAKRAEADKKYPALLKDIADCATANCNARRRLPAEDDRTHDGQKR